MTARRPTAAQVERALRVLARTFGPGFVPDLDGLAPAHVEFVPRLGGGIDTFRVYAVDGERDVLLAQIGRAGFDPPAPASAPRLVCHRGLAPERWTGDEP